MPSPQSDGYGEFRVMKIGSGVGTGVRVGFGVEVDVGVKVEVGVAVSVGIDVVAGEQETSPITRTNSSKVLARFIFFFIRKRLSHRHVMFRGADLDRLHARRGG